MLQSENADEYAVQRLLEEFSAESGRRGYLYLTAAIDHDADLIKPFEQNGFSPIGWEQAWKYQNTKPLKHHQEMAWKSTSLSDLSAINQLRGQILPSAEKWISPSIFQSPPQFSLFLKGDLCGYAYIQKNNKTIIVTPCLSTTIRSPETATKMLLDDYFSNGFYLYILLKSGYVWSESALLEHYKMASNKRTRMVKHLMVKIKDLESERNRVANGSATDVLSPLSKSNAFKDKIRSNTHI